MRAIWIIAKNTFREIIRDQILYGILVFALLLIGLSLVLGQLSFTEHARISADFGFSGMEIAAAVLSVFVGSTLVAREIEKQTILTLLVRPISRAQFLLGKYLGLALVSTLVLASLACVQGLVLMAFELPIGVAFFEAITGVILEAFVLVAVAMFFGAFSRPTPTVIFSAAVFLIGHWIGSLRFFIEKSDSREFRVLATMIVRSMPDLERFNWRSAPIYNAVVPGSEVCMATAYAIGWITILLALTALIFRRRDFV